MIKKNHELLESNVGKMDKVARLALSIALVSVIPHFYLEVLPEFILVMAVLLFSTGLVGYCPVYAYCGISTK